VEVRTDGTDLTVLSRGSGGKVKVQAKDCATGGIFQQEVEAGTPVTATHTLAAGMYYFTNPYTGKINFGDGTRFRGKDSPQAATKNSQSERVTTRTIASGGRLGQVLGEDGRRALRRRHRLRAGLPGAEPPARQRPGHRPPTGTPPPGPSTTRTSRSSCPARPVR